jgi:predicted deacetylase
VVPSYHRDGAGTPSWYRAALERRLALGDELALHGYFHVDSGARISGPLDYLRRRILTDAEGEFAALDESRAAELLARGRSWFETKGWPLAGFVAPAWLLSEGSWRALEKARFAYTTTQVGFHLFDPRRALRVPCMRYSARSAARSAASLVHAEVRALAARSAPMLRVGLHPVDADHPRVGAHAVRVLRQALRTRTPLTKRGLAALLQREPLGASRAVSPELGARG